MSLPTLLVPGSLRTYGTDQAEASKLTPLAYIQGWLRARMPEFGGRSASLADRVLIVRAETGSGKSTVLPVGILRILRAEATPARQRYRGPGVICTQPRVLTAIMLAHDVAVARNPDIVLGETVGYQTKAASTPRATALTYATAGVLAAQLNALTDSELMDQYRFIIVDEAHERTVDSDFILMQLRYFYQRNEGNIKLPFLLLASATFTPLRYATYFGIGAANIVEVHGRSHKITTHWPTRGFNDYPRAAAELAHQIHSVGLEDRPGRSDILIFMPGAREQLLVARILKQLQQDELAAKPEAATYIILILNREVVLSQTGDYTLTFLPPDELPKINGKRPQRRIILSTVVAETGITINTLRYVIDSGWNRNIESYPPWGASGNITRPAAQSRITQRRGRCGRLFPGDFFPLYTQAVYDALDPSQLPDIVSQGASELFLPLVAAQQRQKLLRGELPEFRVEEIALLDPPPPEILLNSIRSALMLGMISMRAPVPVLKQHNMVITDVAGAVASTAASTVASAVASAAASAAASTAVRWQSDIGGALAPVILALDDARPSHRWLREQITIPQKEAITLASIFRIAMMVGLWQGDPDPNLSADYRASGLESLAAYVDSKTAAILSAQISTPLWSALIASSKFE